MKKSILFCVVALGLIFAAGCLQQYWIAEKHSAVVDRYVGKDPNIYAKKGIGGLSTVGEEKAYRQEVIAKYIDESADLEALMRKNEAKYKLIIEDLNANIKTAMDEFNAFIGTVSAPGMVMAALLSIATYHMGRIQTLSTTYTEDEVKIKQKEAQEQVKQTLYTQEEVDKLIAAAKSVPA